MASEENMSCKIEGVLRVVHTGRIEIQLYGALELASGPTREMNMCTVQTSHVLRQLAILSELNVMGQNSEIILQTNTAR
jgi:hypothetical protein